MRFLRSSAHWMSCASLVQDLLTPQRFLKVWAALHEPVADAFSQRQNSAPGLANTGRSRLHCMCTAQRTCTYVEITSHLEAATAGWYTVLRQHHAACIPRSSSPKQLGESSLQSRSSTSSVNSAHSSERADAALGPAAKRRLFPSESSPVRRKVCLRRQQSVSSPPMPLSVVGIHAMLVMLLTKFRPLSSSVHQPMTAAHKLSLATSQVCLCMYSKYPTSKGKTTT